MSTVKREGRGLVNSIINRLPVELHIPGYQYCGPGTKLDKRLTRGDPGINQLDKACKEHDIAYSQHKDIKQRHIADQLLEDRAWRRVKSRDAGLGEKSAAWAVTNTMKVKRKLGMGLSPQKKTCRKDIFLRAKRALKNFKHNDVKEGAKISLAAAKLAVRQAGGRKNVKVPRIIPIPKTGGFLPLIPLFAGLSALGGLAGGAAGITSAVNKVKAARKQLEESQRHNRAMEEIALSKKKGSGLFLKPYRKGMGLFMKPKNY
jgi:hypothetical protein